jgi:hypothetical protein
VSDFSPFALKSGDLPGGGPTALTVSDFYAGAGQNAILPHALALLLVCLTLVTGLAWRRLRK